eukprot:gnl/TRDRNA2_/TRDRNA2_169537_c0_seq3.p1 gnl/TRDRNA2_/TRDRNA2_169537_c0~~gnl/TRDRNA2_/TRDRNA2_169537_c0_seq3.p1  ORF type:complete len:101 (+),score=2.19 gnl/TRDRNA2_/TRDRNA2_169537_c0_seq3:34-336(+)
MFSTYRVGFKVRLPLWAQPMSDTWHILMRDSRLMVREHGRIFGCPHALTGDSMLAAGTSVFGTLDGDLYLFPGSHAINNASHLDTPRSGQLALCSLPSVR